MTVCTKLIETTFTSYQKQAVRFIVSDILRCVAAFAFLLVESAAEAIRIPSLHSLASATELHKATMAINASSFQHSVGLALLQNYDGQHAHSPADGFFISQNQ